MKKIINGKKYDTETAKLISSWDNGYSRNDFYFCSENLYKKKTGEFFLYGEGGPASQYASFYGNYSSWSSDIIPLTTCDAAEWLEQKGDVDKYEEIFGEVEE